MDHWIDDSHFHWQSQNATDPSSQPMRVVFGLQSGAG
jgi:hypothetical protein